MRLDAVTYLTPEELRARLADPPFRHPAVFVSQTGAERWGLGPLLRERQAAGALVWHSKIDSNPTQYSVVDALDTLRRDNHTDGIVAIGGGSAIDLAKAACALWGMGEIGTPEAVRAAIVKKQYLTASRTIPVIAVPSTAGTGSETTSWATVWDADNTAKYSVDAPFLEPREAWIVPGLACSLPPSITLSTGLDAVCHAVEAYWAKPSNPLTKALSLRALQLLTENLGVAIKAPDDFGIRESMATGALLAGLAFSQTKTTACHSISYPLTSMFRIEHGLACALTISEIAQINSKALDLKPLFAVFAPYGGMAKWLDQVSAGICTLRLSSFGIAPNDIPDIVENAFTSGRMDNNPMVLTPEIVTQVLTEIL